MRMKARGGGWRSGERALFDKGAHPFGFCPPSSLAPSVVLCPLSPHLSFSFSRILLVSLPPLLDLGPLTTRSPASHKSTSSGGKQWPSRVAGSLRCIRHSRHCLNTSYPLRRHRLHPPNTGELSLSLLLSPLTLSLPCQPYSTTGVSRHSHLSDTGCLRNTAYGWRLERSRGGDSFAYHIVV